jgi:hypothetical protein
MDGVFCLPDRDRGGLMMGIKIGAKQRGVRTWPTWALQLSTSHFWGSK